MEVKKQKITHRCEKCGEFFDSTGAVKVTTSNAWQRYNRSNRPIISMYSFRLCEKHFKEFDKKLRALLDDF